MKFIGFIFKTIFKIIGFVLYVVVLAFIGVLIWHHTSNYFENKKLKAPGDMISVNYNGKVHAVKMGKGDYTVVFLPGMGTASPYYDYYNLASEVAKNNQVIVVEPLGYGFSDNTYKERTLENYEEELSSVLEYYNIKDNIILLGHSYSGISNLNYANKHSEVKGLVCLDCTTAYQIETHVKDGEFTEEVPKTPEIYSLVSPLGFSRAAFSTIFKSEQNELLEDIPSKFHKSYKHFLYTKTLNNTIVNEINEIYNNQLEILYNQYREDLHVVTFLSDKTIEEMRDYKNKGDFYHDWEEMHNLLISNSNIQKIYTLHGNHYIHHNNSNEISEKIDEMISYIDY